MTYLYWMPDPSHRFLSARGCPGRAKNFSFQLPTTRLATSSKKACHNYTWDEGTPQEERKAPGRFLGRSTGEGCLARCIVKANVKRLLQIFVLIVFAAGLSASARAQVSIGISVRIGPPPLPVYEQPFCPGPNYIWVPGYWAWDGYDYYWVPGTWVLAPQPGYLWTPGYWGWNAGFYVWHPGYWGPHIGFYGGINYGYGYFGTGYEGGYWRGGTFFYNTAINRVNTTVIRNVYVNKTVINNVNVTRVSYNGGQGGIQARPTPQEMAAERERHIGPTQVQQTHTQMARQVPGNFYKQNHGAPVAAALARPATSVNAFHRDAVPARNASMPANNNHMQMNRPGYTATPQNMQRPMQQANRPQPENRPQNYQQHPQSFPQQHQEVRPAPQMERPQPQTRPQEYHPAPQQMHPENRPAPEARPQPHDEPHGGGRFGR